MFPYASEYNCMKGSMSVKTKVADLFTFSAVTAAFLTAAFFALYMPESTAQGVRSGVTCALEVLLPSLFPFMFLSAFAANYGISEAVGRLLSPFTEKILKLPKEAGVTVILSFVGGYPVGAVGISHLLKQQKITPQTAARMLCFCVNPGPAFLITTVGEGMYGSRISGVILFCSQILSGLITAVILGLFSDDFTVISSLNNEGGTRRSFSDSFVLSSRSACSSAVSLCTLVVLFSAFEAMLFDAAGISPSSQLGFFLRALFEVTDGCAAAAQLRMPLWVFAFIAAWGGLCVHFQIFAVMDIVFSRLLFAVSRVAAGTISALITYLALRYTDIGTMVFSNIEKTHAELSSATRTGSIALLLSSVMLLIFISEPKEEIYVRDCRLVFRAGKHDRKSKDT